MINKNNDPLTHGKKLPVLDYSGVARFNPCVTGQEIARNRQLFIPRNVTPQLKKSPKKLLTIL